MSLHVAQPTTRKLGVVMKTEISTVGKRKTSTDSILVITLIFEATSTEKLKGWIVIAPGDLIAPSI